MHTSRQDIGAQPWKASLTEWTIPSKSVDGTASGTQLQRSPRKVVTPIPFENCFHIPYLRQFTEETTMALRGWLRCCDSLVHSSLRSQSPWCLGMASICGEQKDHAWNNERTEHHAQSQEDLLVRALDFWTTSKCNFWMTLTLSSIGFCKYHFIYLKSYSSPHHDSHSPV